jgi:glycolate oxidase FAD binding subunit
MVFKEILSQEQMTEASEMFHPLGNTAAYIAFPHTEQEIAHILAYAQQNGKKVIPMGGGTKRGFGGTDDAADLLLSLSRCTGIVEHSPGDMIVTVRPGITIKELQDNLAEYGQMLPLDPSWPAYATAGGVAMANDSGPKRLRYGSARDHVIAMRVVYPNGTVIRTGAKVVKNVAGYDMNKLFIGSMGTLGVLSEISFKLRPIPKAESLVLLAFPEQAIDNAREFTRSLLDSMLEPVSLELLSPVLTGRLGGKQEYMLAIAFEDVENAVRYQEAWIYDRLPNKSGLTILAQQEARTWWEAFACIMPNGAEESPNDRMKAALKIGSKNVDVLDLVIACHRLGEERNVVIETHGGVGHGLTYAYIEGEDEDELLACMKHIRRLAEEKGGYAIVRHAPLSLRRKIDVWGEKPAYFPLLEGIKQTIDPYRILNPGRFVGGI